MPDTVYLAFLLVDGALAGAIYALVALAFVVVYKASRMINFAMGESIMLGSRMVAAGVHAFGTFGRALTISVLQYGWLRISTLRSKNWRPLT